MSVVLSYESFNESKFINGSVDEIMDEIDNIEDFILPILDMGYKRSCWC